MQTTAATAAFLLLCFSILAHGEVLSIDLSAPVPVPITGHLKMGGKNPQGVEITANSQSLLLDGKPWTPVMGEFHYSRYPREQWEEELLKMKAGGITLVSTYVFWIHHEEVEGQFDWTGDKDLRAFLQLCAKHGLYAWVRLGPWCHGEVRNGGLPDWVLAKSKKTRSLDPAFMAAVKPLYQQISKQIEGMLWKDGGPVVGVQVDNEMSTNAPYLLALKNLAKEVGVDVPLYSVTGWGGVKFPADEVIPLFGGYADGFWEGGSTYSKGDRKQFFFVHTRDDSSIGADLMPYTSRRGAPQNYDRYPFVTCECGGGMQIAYARRPLMTAGDVAALSLVKIGEGSNLPGYYMYQGGRNPIGKLSTLQESQATAYPNDLPIFNYEFQAPLGQYGQVRPSYDALRLIHLFLNDFGSSMANMPSVLPPVSPKNLDDSATPRWAVRSDGKSGFIFLNNYQRGSELPVKNGVQFALKLAAEAQTIPAKPIDIPASTYGIWPFNLDMNGVTLKYATAQLLCKVDDNGVACYVFFPLPGVAAEFAWENGEPEQITSPMNAPKTHTGANGRKVEFLLLTTEQATGAYCGTLGGAQRLILSPNASVVIEKTGLRLQAMQPKATVSVFPAMKENSRATMEGAFSKFELSTPAKSITVDLQPGKTAGPARKVEMGSKKKPMPPEDADFEAAGVWQVKVPADALEGVHEVLLNVDYVGDVARAYVGGHFVDDQFYYGEPWQIGLKTFAPQAIKDGITLKILPLSKALPVYIDEAHRPDFAGQDSVLAVKKVSALPVYEMELRLAE